MKLGSVRHFVRRQWTDIQEGGTIALRYKLALLRRRFNNAMALLLFLPIFGAPLAVIRLMRPWLLVRFGMLESSGIGHFTLSVEIFLREIECGLHNPGQKFVDIWFVQKIVCNRVLLDKWSRILTIWPRAIAQPISLLNQLIPGGRLHNIPYRYVNDRSTPWQLSDIHNVLGSTRPLLTFSREEDSQGFSALKSMGIEKNDSIICFTARDVAFHSERHLRWDHRNSSVHTIAQVMNELTLRGYKAVRMGAKVTERLRSTNPSIIDYSTNGMRTELLDLFLISRCRFMVGTGAGLDVVAPTFRRPLVSVNVAEFGNMDWHGNYLIFIPKRFWSNVEKRFLTFAEIFRLGAHLFSMTWQYRREGIEWVDNDVDEIRAVVLEMEQRLSGSWVSNPEDEELQSRFRSIWPLRQNGRPLQARIGADFLRQHPEVLG